MRVISFTCQVLLANAHGGLIQPSTWMNQYGTIPHEGGKQTWAEGHMWFMNWTFVPQNVQATLTLSGADPPLENSPRGYGMMIPNLDYYVQQKHPWVAPGTAPLDSPCGIQGGNKDGCFTGNGFSPTEGGNGGNTKCAGGGDDRGQDSLTYDFVESPVTYWEAGSVQDTAWGVVANHGGGYTYRLCPVTSFANSEHHKITEECFESNGLDFVGHKQWLQYKAEGRQEINAFDVDTNLVNPKGSKWRKNPIPACRDWSGNGAANCQPWFTPPITGASGFGNANGGLTAASDFMIIDKVQVPSTPGKFVLGWRYDCEQTPQVWLGCANIEIHPQGSPAPAPPFGCICPPSKALKTGYMAPSVARYNINCGQAEAYAQSMKHNPGQECSVVQQWYGWGDCCEDLPPAAEPEPEPESEPIASPGSAPEADPLVQPPAPAPTTPAPTTTPTTTTMPTTPAPPAFPAGTKAECMCGMGQSSKFTANAVAGDHGGTDFNCKAAADYVNQHGQQSPCDEIKYWGHPGPLWSTKCCGGTLLAEVKSTKFANHVQIKTHAHEVPVEFIHRQAMMTIPGMELPVMMKIPVPFSPRVADHTATVDADGSIHLK